jgi:hypothetical protein
MLRGLVSGRRCLRRLCDKGEATEVVVSGGGAVDTQGGGGYLERNKSEIHLEFVLIQILTNSSVHLSILEFTWHSHAQI